MAILSKTRQDYSSLWLHVFGLGCEQDSSSTTVGLKIIFDKDTLRTTTMLHPNQNLELVGSVPEHR
jgi:hypothetical protein